MRRLLTRWPTPRAPELHRAGAVADRSGRSGADTWEERPASHRHPLCRVESPAPVPRWSGVESREPGVVTGSHRDSDSARRRLLCHHRSQGVRPPRIPGHAYGSCHARSAACRRRPGSWPDRFHARCDAADRHPDRPGEGAAARDRPSHEHNAYPGTTVRARPAWRGDPRPAWRGGRGQRTGAAAPRAPARLRPVGLPLTSRDDPRPERLHPPPPVNSSEFAHEGWNSCACAPRASSPAVVARLMPSGRARTTTLGRVPPTCGRRR
jgi:hypothetical protein